MAVVCVLVVLIEHLGIFLEISATLDPAFPKTVGSPPLTPHRHKYLDLALGIY